MMKLYLIFGDRLFALMLTLLLKPASFCIAPTGQKLKIDEKPNEYVPMGNTRYPNYRMVRGTNVNRFDNYEDFFLAENGTGIAFLQEENSRSKDSCRMSSRFFGAQNEVVPMIG